MFYSKLLAAFVTILMISSGASVASAHPPRSATPAFAEYRVEMLGQSAPEASAGTHVFLLKGLADIFSGGMDTLAARLAQRGIRARVANHGASHSLSQEVIRNYSSGGRSPVVIVGHSFGADATIDMARQLNEAKVPVALVVTFGPGTTMSVPANVSRAINYYLTSGLWRGRLIPGAGFKGSISNVNLDKSPDVTHFNIEKIDRLQADTANAIAAAVGRRK